jgi:hypothetical protein
MATSRIWTPALVAGGLLAGALVAAGALTASGALAAPSPTPSSSGGEHGYGPGSPGRGPSWRGGAGPGFGSGPGGFGGNLLHGQFVVQSAGGTRTELVQSGAVTANSGSTVTVKSSDGFSVVWTVDSTTVLRSGRNTVPVQDLTVGADVTAIGSPTGSGGTATSISERPAAGSGGRGAAPSPGGGQRARGAGQNPPAPQSTA